ncbi:MAG TPA: secondary thiamine-phosphate synthase enzyme YjbQ [Saprospiraceae bacterium]|nr:secondary thiamine-phosphate synthase enzyme YjbQ [Saprospiraceae bacterium]
MVRHYSISVGPFSRGFHMITNVIADAVTEWPEDGLMHVFLKHTSAGLCINENADATVRDDFKLYFDRLAPEDLPGITHDMEGPDDMPAHIKSALTGVSVTIPIVKSKLDLGVWQGIYLCEFRNRARRREITISIID